jgi:hypothetical protein
VRTRDEFDEKEVIKAFVSPEEMEEFREIEDLLAYAKPGFDGKWKEDLVRRLLKEDKGAGFYWKSMIAASLLIAAVSSSLFLFNSGFQQDKEVNRTVSKALVSELVLSFDGKLESDLDDVMAAAEEKYESQDSVTDTYIKDLVGGNDEDDIS